MSQLDLIGGSVPVKPGVKLCLVCRTPFRRKDESQAQWERRACCSRKCAGIRSRRQHDVRLCACGCGEPVNVEADGRARARYRPGHPDARTRLLAGIVINADGCWIWQRSRNEDGYGCISVGGKILKTHRLSYSLFIGLIPDRLPLDHMCHDATVCAGGPDCPHRPCCNYAHLEAVTSRVNTLRANSLPAAQAARTHCPRGHPYDELNTLLYRGGRYCRTCRGWTGGGYG